jgi:integrase
VSFIHKRGRKWWYYWSEGGRKRGHSLKTSDKVVAEIKKGAEDRRRAFNEMGLSSPDSRSEDFKTEYLEFSKAKKRPATYAKDKSVLEAFFREVSHKLNSIDQRAAEAYLTALSLRTSKANANVHYRHLKAAFRKAVSWSHLPKSPLQEVKPFRLEQRAPRFLSKPEIDAMLSKALKDPHPDAYGLAMAYLWTGMRLSEALALKWADVDLPRRSLRAFGKGGKERTIRIPKELLAV